MTSFLIFAICIVLICIVSICLISFFDIHTITYITIISLFFPIYIQFMGNDAFTTGTVLIFLLYLSFLVNSFKDRKFLKEKYDIWIYLLIFNGFVAIIYGINTWALGKDLVGIAIRQYFSFFSAMVLFLVIKNHRQDDIHSQFIFYTNHIENLISLFLIFISIHALFSICVKYFPSFGYLFRLFQTSNITSFAALSVDGVERLGSFVFSYEEFAEILAALSPLVMYKIFKFRNPIWIVCLSLFALGEMLTVTRSGIILFIVGFFCSLLYHFWDKIRKFLILLSMGITVLFVIIFFQPSVLRDIIIRFGEAYNISRSGGNIVESINRDAVFVPAWDSTTSNISLFGNCISEFNFHNLFLTILHQKGVVGAILFFPILLYPAFRLVRFFPYCTGTNKSLVFSCLLSIALFLFNESKFEFTRGSSYQQIWWGIFGVYYLVSNINQQSKDYPKNFAKPSNQQT